MGYLIIKWSSFGSDPGGLGNHLIIKGFLVLTLELGETDWKLVDRSLYPQRLLGDRVFLNSHTSWKKTKFILMIYKLTLKKYPHKTLKFSKGQKKKKKYMCSWIYQDDDFGTWYMTTIWKSEGKWFCSYNINILT